MLSAERIALLKHGAPPRNALEAALRNVWYGGGGASYEKTVGPAPIISISDAKAKPAKSLIVGMEPIQDLHGYDHPWTAGGGKNMLPNAVAKTETISGVTATLDAYGVFTVKGTSTINDNINFNFPLSTSFVIPSGDPKPKFVMNNSNGNGCLFRFFNNGIQVDSWGITPVNRVSEYTGMQGKTCDEYVITIPDSQIGVPIDFTMAPMIVENSVTDYSFAPYSNICPISGRTGVTVDHSGADTSDPQTYHVMFPDGKTVYGGTVDLVSGVLTVTDAEIASYNGETLPSTWISDRDVYADGTTPTIGAQVVYELATPQTYQLTPTQIQLLKGSNVLWSDADDLTLTYIGTTPANLLGGMLGGGFGGAQEPIEETSEESVEEPVSDEPTKGEGE